MILGKDDTRVNLVNFSAFVKEARCDSTVSKDSMSGGIVGFCRDDAGQQETRSADYCGEEVFHDRSFQVANSTRHDHIS